MNSPGHRQPAAWLQPVGVRYEHNQDLPALKELAALFSIYQAGPVVRVGSYQGQTGMGLTRFDQAMGLCRTASVIAVSTRDAIWSLLAHREIAAYIKPGGEHAIAFLVRSCHHSGPEQRCCWRAVLAICAAGLRPDCGGRASSVLMHGFGTPWTTCGAGCHIHLPQRDRPTTIIHLFSATTTPNISHGHL